MPLIHPEHVWRNILPYLVLHDEHAWTTRKHYGFCGQSCPCCRFCAGDFLGSCTFCEQGLAAACVSSHLFRLVKTILGARNIGASAVSLAESAHSKEGGVLPVGEVIPRQHIHPWAPQGRLPDEIVVDPWNVLRALRSDVTQLQRAHSGIRLLQSFRHPFMPQCLSGLLWWIRLANLFGWCHLCFLPLPVPRTALARWTIGGFLRYCRCAGCPQCCAKRGWSKNCHGTPCWRRPGAGLIKTGKNELMVSEEMRCACCLVYLETGGETDGTFPAAAFGADTNAGNGGTSASVGSGNSSVIPAANSPGSAAPGILELFGQFQDLCTHVEYLARRVEASEAQRVHVEDLAGRVEALEEQCCLWQPSWN